MKWRRSATWNKTRTNIVFFPRKKFSKADSNFLQRQWRGYIYSSAIDTLNNLWPEFIKRVVGARGGEFENFEKLWAGRKVHFYSIKFSKFFFIPKMKKNWKNPYKKLALMALGKNKFLPISVHNKASKYITLADDSASLFFMNEEREKLFSIHVTKPKKNFLSKLSRK